ncbi:oxidative stress defense protein [Vibrio sp. Isolate25]|uniref:oxidative stress defense protein n=1 Tax=Vibrio TaxID=662 RepID=UPI001EFC49D6|nr:MULTISPECIES: oxidative stress defense protein [Vibrio]MCG9599116.1 oxidative stress defense protein [Vibrio sp. Isolate25]MCG9680054.1 oxidative stress defense protein [Vibrio sp. Isolate24]MCG9684569.1 oxidative stress defense protein [Vibrio sp. Isolate23]USD32920.1 oxidative stress defense protein [Vibrio sp. SCSIO 43186]USD45959.1 oxidative stress defense protein [Vibrio sp. SCSIO 43145]
MKRVSSLAIAVSGLVSIGAYADTPNFPHLATTGYGEVVAKPDMAKFTVRVVETTMTAEQAKQTVDKVVSDFLSELKDEGMSADNITSSNLYISPQYHYPKDGKPELVGYRASRTVNVTVDELANLNQYLDIALNSGINQVENIQLKVKEQAKYQEQARQAAIKDANSKAESLASGFGKDINGVWRIDYNMPSSQPVLMRSMAMDAKAESNTYQDSTIVIRDRVDVIYQLD